MAAKKAIAKAAGKKEQGKNAVKKGALKNAVVKKAVVKKAVVKKAVVKEAVVKEAVVENAVVKKAVVKKAAVKKAAVKKAIVKKAGMKNAIVNKAGMKTAVVKKVVVKRPALVKAPAAKLANPLVPIRRDTDAAALPPLPRVPAGVLLGTHVSSQGGSFAAPPRASDIGATALQLFTKTPNQWKEREIDANEASLFRAALLAAGSPVTVSHDSYLINLASPDDAARARSLESFVAELRRCEALGIDYLVSHPGNYMQNRDEGIARNAAAIASALIAVSSQTVLCLEATAGTGTALGATFEELAAIIALLPVAVQPRVGICVDTCHIFSAGYDIVNNFDGVIDTFDRVLGLSRLRVWHLNDSKTPFNSHRDRHELIGSGSLGDAPFRRIMTDPRFSNTVKILETPKLDDATATDRTMLNRLLAFL